MKEYNHYEHDSKKNHVTSYENKTYEEQLHPEASFNHNVEEENLCWHNDDFEPAMSGVVSEKNALSIYKPRLKRRFDKRPIFAAVISGVLTSVLCFGIFAGAMGVFSNKQDSQRPASSTFSLGDGSETIKPVVNTTGGQMTIPDIYDKVSPAVVSIISTMQSGNSYLQNSTATGSGSGVILTADGYIVTNNHVVDGASIITVKTTANQSFDAQVVGKDARTDLAVLKVESDKGLPFAELGDSSLLRVGDMALAIGNPLQEALASTLTVGYISAINRTMVIEDRQMTMLQTDAAINPGNSGGALINMFGQVIGINTAKSTGYDIEGLGFAIPINEAIPVVESIIEHGYVKGRPLVGITGIDVTERIAKANNLPIGVYVDSVQEGGAADKGGIKAGDVILKFDGKEITSIDEINKIRDDHKVGDTIEILISRNGTKKTVTIKLQEEQPMEEDTKQQETQQSTERPDVKQFPSDFFSWFGW